MQKNNHAPWKVVPFVRLLLPFIAGIAIQWYLQVSFPAILVTAACFTAAVLLFNLLPLSLRFMLQFVQGILLHGILLCFGALIVWQKDIRNHTDWYGNFYDTGAALVVHINEPLTEKERSYKATGYAEAVIRNDNVVPCKGKLLLYFSKDSSLQQLNYGDRILISKGLQDIKNSGNPGAFNYRQYSAFHQTFHTVFLDSKDLVILKDKAGSPLQQFIFSAREKILAILQRHAGGNKDELGIAEALLIGYTNDLDKDLVQAYSNTGVVHIIAISGMHLALIYVMLSWIFSRLPFIKRMPVVQLVLVLGCLWLFALLTGGSASVLRSAVMFSFIKCGQTFFKRSSIYNSLAASAFVLLCYDPFYLWDVGFQLSYLAVTSILAFQKPVYHCVYTRNKWLDKIWQMVAVTIAAQVLTFPVCIYYFHQFPVLFLITNLIAVPLSTIILYAAIVLVAFSWLPFVGGYAGKLVQLLVGLMNKVIVWMNELPFAVWDNIWANVLSTVALYSIVIATAIWLLNKSKTALKLWVGAVLAFTAIQTFARWHFRQQRKLIIYNVPKCRAIDIIEGNKYCFIGDSVLSTANLLTDFHLKPARTTLQLNERQDSLASVLQQGDFLLAGNKRVLLMDKPLRFEPLQKKVDIDMIVISKNARVSIAQLAGIFNCRQYVFDASNNSYRIGKWKKECGQLNIHCYAIPERGAFICDTED